MKIAAGIAIVLAAVIAGHYVSGVAAVWFIAAVAAHTSPAMAVLAMLIRIIVWLAVVVAGFWLAIWLNAPHARSRDGRDVSGS